MYRIMLVSLSLSLVSCYTAPPTYSHDHRFTIPFARDVDLTIWEPQERSVELHLGAPRDLLAPGDVKIIDIWQNGIMMSDFDEEVIMVMEDLDYIEAEPGEVFCGGEVIGNTQQVRIRAYWGLSDIANYADLSLVRVVRNSLVTDLSDMRVADQVHSALATSDSQELQSDINWGHCPFGGE